MRCNTPPCFPNGHQQKARAAKPASGGLFYAASHHPGITVELDYEKTTPNMVSFDPGGKHFAALPQTPSRKYLITWILFSH
jgi:hypothetical protein